MLSVAASTTTRGCEGWAVVGILSVVAGTARDGGECPLWRSYRLW